MTYNVFILEEIGKALKSIDHDVYNGKYIIFVTIRDQNIKTVGFYGLKVNDFRKYGVYHTLNKFILRLKQDGLKFSNE